MINVNSVSAASAAANNLNSNQRNLQRSLLRLSTGYRINSSADDPGGLAVSLKLSTSIRKTEAISSNVGNAVSFLQTQDGVLAAASSILGRMSELSVLAQDETKTDDDRTLYDAEFTELKASMNALLSEEFNGISLFDAAGNTLQVTTGESGSSMDMTQANLDAVDGAVAPLAVDSIANAATAQAALDTQIEALGILRARNGAEQSRLTFAQDILAINTSNLEAARGRVVDVDMAKESSEFTRLTIKREAGIAMLAQANASSTSVLKLIS
jgi:flagellin